MKPKYILLIFLLLTACSGEEKLIDNFNDTSKALFIYNIDNKASIAKVDLLNGSVLDENILAKISQISDKDTISLARHFRDNIFLFAKASYKIYVLDFNTLEYKYTIDFSQSQSIPADIAFANATDAFITFENSDKVALLDLTNFAVAKQIKVGNSPRSIAAAGNQIYVANYSDHSVSVIDSRTNKQEAVISVAPFPVYVGVRSDGKEVVVVSRGLGKDFTDVVPTAAIATIIDVATRQKVAEIPIGTSTIKAETVLPISSVITNSNYLFVTNGSNLLRINIKNRTAAFNVGKFSYQGLFFNNFRNELIALAIDEQGNTKKINICDRSMGTINYSVNVKAGLRWILPIY
ncbi:MAG TPA: hypothetical protein PLU67_02510 [Candidatus Kapabacteria bacterium]|nr:hypothetical protein [Candidatus Kapabacteria bacterium]HPP39332.1 hypothetical protein [Candidatus Kapabacteria bacterium]HPU23044.1 hypothetical protein [Candidatus Kapabacteria bacterium]